MTNVYVKVFDGGKLPEYQSENAAGCDVYAACDMTILPGETKIVPLNFIMAMSEDIEAQVRPRSGLSLKTDIRLANCVGTIDSDYRDNVGVIIQNTYNPATLPFKIVSNANVLNDLKENYKKTTIRDYMKGKVDILDYDSKSLDEICYIDKNGNPYGTVYIKKGERIAQIIFSKVKRAKFIIHNNPEEIGHNRGGGFGHTGR